jgi:hypothetical protein
LSLASSALNAVASATPSSVDHLLVSSPMPPSGNNRGRSPRKLEPSRKSREPCSKDDILLLVLQQVGCMTANWHKIQTLAWTPLPALGTREYVVQTRNTRLATNVVQPFGESASMRFTAFVNNARSSRTGRDCQEQCVRLDCG